MTVGSKTYNGLGVPLYGESEVVGQTAATDILTLTGASSQSGDYLVLRDTNGSELLYIDADGTLSLRAHSDHSSFARLNFDILNTFPTTTNVDTGDIWLTKVTTDVYALTLCVSGAGKSIKRMRRAVIDVTLGSAS